MGLDRFGNMEDVALTYDIFEYSNAPNCRMKKMLKGQVLNLRTFQMWFQYQLQFYPEFLRSG